MVDRRRRIAAGVLVAVVGGALAVGGVSAGRARVRTVDDDPAVLRDELDPLLDVLARQPPGRLLTASEFGSGSHVFAYLPFAYVGRPAVRAYGGAPLQSSPNYRYLRTAPLYLQSRLYDARYLLARKGGIAGRAELVAETANHVLIALPTDGYLAPVELVGTAPAERDARSAAVDAWLAGDGPAAGRHLVIGAPPPPHGVGNARVDDQREGFSSYLARVTVTGPDAAAIAARVSYHPRWRAWIDGEPAAILRISPDMMAVIVPPGAHELQLAFSRPWWIAALLLLAVALVAAAERIARITEPRLDRSAPVA